MKYFGTDGFRGRANEGLNVEHAFKIGRFVGWYYGARQDRKARVVVGKDTRRSSYMFESALVAGLVACLWQALPGKTAKEIIRLVRDSSDNVSMPDNIYGYGVPDFWKAYRAGRGK